VCQHVLGSVQLVGGGLTVAFWIGGGSGSSSGLGGSFGLGLFGHLGGTGDGGYDFGEKSEEMEMGERTMMGLVRGTGMERGA